MPLGRSPHGRETYADLKRCPASTPHLSCRRRATPLRWAAAPAGKMIVGAWPPRHGFG